LVMQSWLQFVELIWMCWTCRLRRLKSTGPTCLFKHLVLPRHPLLSWMDLRNGSGPAHARTGAGPPSNMCACNLAHPWCTCTHPLAPVRGLALSRGLPPAAEGARPSALGPCPLASDVCRDTLPEVLQTLRLGYRAAAKLPSDPAGPVRNPATPHHTGPGTSPAMVEDTLPELSSTHSTRCLRPQDADSADLAPTLSPTPSAPPGFWYKQAGCSRWIRSPEGASLLQVLRTHGIRIHEDMCWLAAGRPLRLTDPPPRDGTHVYGLLRCRGGSVAAPPGLIARTP
jgi:hypothetical protein